MNNAGQAPVVLILPPRFAASRGWKNLHLLDLDQLPPRWVMRYSDA